MRYIVKQSVISVDARYLIEDEAGNLAFKVYRQAISLMKRWFFRDATGVDNLIINKKIFSLLPKFEIFFNDDTYAIINKKFSLLNDTFEVTSSYGNYVIRGNKFSFEYQIFKNEVPVATVSKKWVSLGDTYGVEIDENEKATFLLALIISVDASHEGR